MLDIVKCDSSNEEDKSRELRKLRMDLLNFSYNMLREERSQRRDAAMMAERDYDNKKITTSQVIKNSEILLSFVLGREGADNE